MTSDTALRAGLDERLRSRDRIGAVERAHASLDDGSVTLGDLYRVLSEILVDVGVEWQRGTAEVWQEHFVTGVVRTIVESCATRVEAAAPEERGATVVLAAPGDEYHDLGLRMLTDRFILAGWRAHFLGGNLPVAELSAAVEELGADAVALSASTHFHRVALKSYISILSTARPQLRIWVGGPAFAREHEGWEDELMLDPLDVPAPGDL